MRNLAWEASSVNHCFHNCGKNVTTHNMMRSDWMFPSREKGKFFFKKFILDSLSLEDLWQRFSLLRTIKCVRILNPTKWYLMYELVFSVYFLQLFNLWSILHHVLVMKIPRCSPLSVSVAVPVFVFTGKARSSVVTIKVVIGFFGNGKAKQYHLLIL